MSRERVSIVVGVALSILILSTTSGAVSDPAAPPVDALDQARQHFEAGRYGEAADLLNARLEYAPPDAAAYFWLGRSRFELRDYAGAIAALERGVQLNPDDSEYHRWLGRIYGEEADRKRSLSLAGRVRRQFENAVRLGPKNFAARRDLLEYYLEAPWILGGGDDKARQQVTAITALDSIEGHAAYAAYLAHRSDYSQAAAEYRAAVNARPARIDSCFEAAEFFEKREDAGGLRAAVEGAASVDASEPRLLYFRGVAGVIAGAEPAAAESLLHQYLAVPARSDRPSASAAHEWLGRLYEKSGRVSEARSEYRASTALNPDRKSPKERLRRLE